MVRVLFAEEFVAHPSSVNCLKIGRKSSGVLVTGGEDKLVNVWAIGKPNALMVRPLLMPGISVGHNISMPRKGRSTSDH